VFSVNFENISCNIKIIDSEFKHHFQFGLSEIETELCIITASLLPMVEEARQMRFADLQQYQVCLSYGNFT